MASPSLRYVAPPAAPDTELEPQPVVIYDLPSGGGGGGAVDSVNGKTGEVVLSASDVGARAAGNVPWGEVTGVPTALTAAQAAGTASIRAIGTTATTAAAGNHTHTWDSVTGKPAVIAAGADAAAARAAIGAGTSNLSIGTSGTNAAAGNHTHAWSAITGKPAVIAAGATAAEARTAIGAVADTFQAFVRSSFTGNDMWGGTSQQYGEVISYYSPDRPVAPYIVEVMYEAVLTTPPLTQHVANKNDISPFVSLGGAMPGFVTVMKPDGTSVAGPMRSDDTFTYLSIPLDVYTNIEEGDTVTYSVKIML